MMGMKLSRGPGLATPIAADSQPHWNTATVAPKVAPMVSRKPSAAFNGTSTDRNIRISSTKDSPITSSR
jgi:hypothetical protein